MDSEAQPTPAVTTGEPAQETASAPSSLLEGRARRRPLLSTPDPDRAEAPPPAPLSDPRQAEAQRPASISFLVVVTVLSLAADLVSKHYAKSRLSGFDVKTHAMHRVEIWKGHVDFIFAQNPGGAWSFLRGLPDTLRRPFFLVVSAAAIVFIISIYRRIGDDQRAMKWGLPSPSAARWATWSTGCGMAGSSISLISISRARGASIIGRPSTWRTLPSSLGSA